MAWQRVPFGRLSETEASYLHPNNWNGDSIGIKGGRVPKMTGLNPPVMNTRMMLDLSFADKAVHTAVALVRNGQFPRKKARQIVHYPAGSQVDLAEHGKGVVMADRSTLITRGDLYLLTPEGMPEEPPLGPFPQYLEHGYRQHYETPLFHYLRELVPITDRRESPTGYVAMTNMEGYIADEGYALPLGVLAVPRTVELGAVSHHALPDCQQVLTVTHSVTVYPKL